MLRLRAGGRRRFKGPSYLVKRKRATTLQRQGQASRAAVSLSRNLISFIDEHLDVRPPRAAVAFRCSRRVREPCGLRRGRGRSVHRLELLIGDFDEPHLRASSSSTSDTGRSGRYATMRSRAIGLIRERRWRISALPRCAAGRMRVRPRRAAIGGALRSLRRSCGTCDPRGASTRRAKSCRRPPQIRFPEPSSDRHPCCFEIWPECFGLAATSGFSGLRRTARLARHDEHGS